MGLRKTLIRQGTWFFSFNAILLIIISSRYFSYISGTDSFYAFIYLTIATFSHFLSLSFLLAIPFFVFVLVYPNKVMAWILAAILATVGSSSLLLDTFVYDFYRIHINRFILELIFGGAGSQVFEFHTSQYILIFGTVIVFFIILFYVSYRFFNWKGSEQLKHGKWLVISMFVLLLVTHISHAWVDIINYTPITKSSRYFPLFFPTTAKNLAADLGLLDEAESRKKLIDANMDEQKGLNYPRHKIMTPINSKENIFFIILDSWYYKSFNQKIMPNIYAFSKKAAFYNKHYSGSNGTRTGMFSLFYSIPGTYWDIALATKTSPVLIDQLLEENYEIRTFPSASLKSPPLDVSIFSKVKKLKIETFGETASDRDRQITVDWLEQSQKDQLDSNKTPQFTLLFYDALHAISHPKNYHGPFQPEWDYPKYEDLDNYMDPTPFLNLYKNSAHYVDSLVGIVLMDLEKKGYLENSWIVITGDHGQEFNDNKKNYWGHNGNYSAAQMQVPLVIYKPKTDHKVYKHWTSHYDIVPTLFNDLFNVSNPIKDYSIGKLLNDTTKRDWLIVGSSDNWAILEENRINSIYFNGQFNITDEKLNPIKDAKLNISLINRIIKLSNRYYNK